MSFGSKKIFFSLVVLSAFGASTANRTANDTVARVIPLITPTLNLNFTTTKINPTRIIPIQTLKNFPKTHERIIVPLESYVREEVIDKPVTEHAIESNVKRRLKSKHLVSTEAPTEAPVKQSRQSKRNPKNYDDGRSYNYVTKTEHPRGKSDHGPNPIQPLHIHTQGFHKKMPNMSGHKGPHRVNKEKLIKQHLPPNPEEIPQTTWFDNTGKYYYGIVHGEYFTEPPEYSNNQQPGHTSSERVIEPPPQKVFKSSFRDPKYIQPQKPNSDNLANFLYKSEIHYPSYRNHLYPPVTVYGDYQALPTPATKEMLHPKVPSPKVPKKPPPAPPVLKKEPPKRVPVPANAGKQAAPAENDDEDYEEDSSEDGDDSSNDRYDGDAPGDDDEGDEEDGDDEEKSSDDGRTPSKSFRYDEVPHHSYRSGESDEFDKAWAKFGYGRSNSGSGSDESSFESSETQMAPQRIKFYHEKKEEITTRLTTTTEKPIKKITKVVSGKINNSQPKPKPTIPPKPISDRSQEDARANEKKDRPDDGPDDLKYFQDLYLEKKSPLEIEFGHISETPKGWEERYERQNHDHKVNRHQGKVRWADKLGGFGEHYWDLNH